MKYICTLLLCFILLSCTATKVHLYSRYLSPAEISVVKNKLTELGFKVEINTLTFPDEVTQSALIYSPFIESEERLNSLIEAISTLGWKLQDPQMLMTGNHWYTKNNVGLFLVPEGARASNTIITQDLANEYQSRHCAIAASITLKNDSSYKMSFQKSINKRDDFMSGHWKITAFPYLELKSSNNEWFFYFKIQTSKTKDQIGEVNIIELVPEDNYSVLPKCSFAYGLRS